MCAFDRGRSPLYAIPRSAEDSEDGEHEAGEVVPPIRGVHNRPDGITSLPGEFDDAMEDETECPGGDFGFEGGRVEGGGAPGGGPGEAGEGDAEADGEEAELGELEFVGDEAGEGEQVHEAEIAEYEAAEGAVGEEEGGDGYHY